MIQAICKRIELEKPKKITLTRTRKHLATVPKLLGMSTPGLTWITNHVEHTKKRLFHLVWEGRLHTRIDKNGEYRYNSRYK